MRSRRASIAAASSVTNALLSGSAIGGMRCDHGRQGTGARPAVARRIRASMTAAMSRAPVSGALAIASAATLAGSSPAASTDRSGRHSQVAVPPSSGAD